MSAAFGVDPRVRQNRYLAAGALAAGALTLWYYKKDDGHKNTGRAAHDAGVSVGQKAEDVGKGLQGERGGNTGKAVHNAGAKLGEKAEQFGDRVGGSVGEKAKEVGRGLKGEEGGNVGKTLHDAGDAAGEKLEEVGKGFKGRN